jgi:prepilin-type N-terminal cleavage/methylation domain-containing protein
MLKLRKMLKKNRKGFTLIELIVVLAILAIIALLAIPRFLSTLEESQIKTDQASARTIVSAVALYQANEADPTAEPAIGDLTGDYIDANLTSAQDNAATWSINYDATNAGVVESITLTGDVTEATVYPQ